MPSRLAPLDISRFLELQHEPYDWLIPGLLERGDRLILTGGEGKGKSTFMRQFGLRCALGIHPFDDTLEINPLKVLLVDFENSPRQSSRALARVLKDHEAPTGQFSIVCYQPGLNLNEVLARVEMAELLSAERPDLLLIGPMYKMADGLEREENSSALATKLDEWRTFLDFALIMESHQPHPNVVEGRLNRPERPYGSSLWLRWPEFGICLENEGVLRHWRGARDERDWPEKLKHGEDWPWEVDSKVCLVCGLPLLGRKVDYCSESCGAVWRKRRQRARQRASGR